MIRYIAKVSAAKLAGIALLRLDFNTQDAWRMEASLPTVVHLARRASAVVIVSHRGRPQGVHIRNGVPSGFEKGLSLAKDARVLSRLLKRKVKFLPHFRFADIRAEISVAAQGSIFLLENLRFLEGEAKNDAALAKQLARCADYYVNDAFAVSHRANASVAAVTKFLPKYGGILLEKEVKHLSSVMKQPKRPLVMVFGGAKANDKLPVMQYFKSKADCFLLSGALSNTVLRAKGIGIGKSITDEHPNPVIHEIIRYSNLVLPIDYQIREERILDVGPKTVKYFGEKIQSARTIIWNGPLGLIEKPPFHKGTLGLARLIAANRRAFSVVGGGETVMFLKKHKLDKKITFTSTGGGAMLEFLAGKKLPGLAALQGGTRHGRKALR